MALNTLPDWLAYLETLHPNAIDLGLERVKAVASQLNLQRPATTVITITGTNGKGSCVASLNAIYLEAGYRTGAYTSPHLWHFTERILVAGVPVTEEMVCAAFALIEEARGAITLTYFEFTTLAAFLIFQQQALDIAILEVGMGGRLDAVNIIDPDISVITTIDLDHQAWLGDTREQIGYEKSGIMREGIPLVGGRDLPSSVYAMAKTLHVPLYILGKDFDCKKISKHEFFWKNPEKTFKNLYNNHLLVDNIALSLMVVGLLKNQFPVTDETVKKALAHCSLSGRQQVFTTPIWQLFDVAHNRQGIAALAETLAQTPCAGRTLAVFSMLGDKDISGSIAAISAHIDAWYVAGLAVERGMTTPEIAECVQAATPTPVYAYANIVEAYQNAYQIATVQDRIVVFGSFYTVATVLPRATKK